MKRPAVVSGASTEDLAGNVLNFPAAGSRRNRLTKLDRQQVTEWVTGPYATWCYISIFADPNEADDIGDFISVYRVNEDWASWGIARRGDSIILWETKHGKDLGVFSSTFAALDAIWLLLCDPSPPTRVTMKLHKRSS